MKSVINSNSVPGTALAELRERLDITSTLRELASSRTLTEIIGSGQLHDNGFAKIIIATSPVSGMKAVLHVWPNDTGTAGDNIHNHRWDFASVVLRGELQVEIYARTDGESYPAFSYKSPSGGDTYSLEPNGPISAARVALIQLPRTSTYSWDHQVLHRAFGIGTPGTVTFIIQGRPQQDSTTVLVRGGRTYPADHPVTRMSQAEIRDRLLGLAADAGLSSAWCES